MLQTAVTGPQQTQTRPTAAAQPIAAAPDQIVIWQQFLKERPEFSIIARNPTAAPGVLRMQQEFAVWKNMKIQQQQQFQWQQQAAARASVAPQPTPAARLATTTAATTSSLQQRAAESQNLALKKLAGQFNFITKPTSNEEKSFLPNTRLNLLAKKAYGELGVGKLTPDAAAGMKALASDFSKEAISYAIAAARRKRANKLDPNDIVLYLQHTWGIELPEFSVTRTGGGVVAPYKRLSASDIHKARLAAVRRGNVAQTRLTAAGGGAGGSGAAGASGSGGAAVTTGTGTAAGGKSTGKPVHKKKIMTKAAFAAATAAAAAAKEKGTSETEHDGEAGESDDEMEEDMPDIM